MLSRAAGRAAESLGTMASQLRRAVEDATGGLVRATGHVDDLAVAWAGPAPDDAERRCRDVLSELRSWPAALGSAAETLDRWAAAADETAQDERRARWRLHEARSVSDPADSGLNDLTATLGELSAVIESGVLDEHAGYLVHELGCYYVPERGSETSWARLVRDRIASRTLERGLLPPEARSDVVSRLAALGLEGSSADGFTSREQARRIGVESPLDEVFVVIGLMSLVIAMPDTEGELASRLESIRSDIAGAASERWPHTSERPRMRKHGR